MMRLHFSIYSRPHEVLEGDKFKLVKYSVGNYLARWSVMCFRSDEEDMKIPGSVADSSGCHIPPTPGSDLGPWNFSRYM